MTSIEILSALQDYISLLNTIRDRQVSANPGQEFIPTVSLSYNNINLKLDTRNGANENNVAATLYLKCAFEIDQEKVFNTEVYCENKGAEADLKEFILHHTPPAGYPWNTQPKANLYDEALLSYISSADRIAKPGHDCASGDRYAPGYYSNMIVTENSIVLEQINRWNSKSLDHKNDYHMRDLKIFIPLTPRKKKESGFEEFQLGKMSVFFSDRSSKNNRSCGDAIMDKILEEKRNF
jgi:hypothetical protein